MLTAGSLAVAGVVGYTTLRSPPQLSLRLLNFVDELHLLRVELLRPDAETRSAALMLREEYRLPAPDEGAAADRLEPDAVESRPYRVRAHLGTDDSVRGSYDFFPSCTDGDELLVEIHRGPDDDEPYIDFGQRKC